MVFIACNVFVSGPWYVYPWIYFYNIFKMVCSK